MYSVAFLVFTAFVCCLFLTPIVRRLSERAGLVDQPNVKRKWHQKPTARTGGVAIGLSYLAALGLLLVSRLNGADTVNLPLALHLVPAAAVMFVVGLLDDLRGLNAWQKLLGQGAAALLAYFGGVHVTGVALWRLLVLCHLFLISESSLEHESPHHKTPQSSIAW